MIKPFSLLAFLAMPSFAFGQTVAPERPNHTLPQYRIATAANSNAGAPSSMLRMATPSTGSYTAPWSSAGIRKDTRIPSLYADGSTGTLEQIGQMADGSVQQAGANKPQGYVQPDANGMITLPVSGDSSSASVMASGASIASKMSETLPLLSNLKSYTYGNGTADDARLLDAFVSNNCNRAINVPAGYILPTNTNGGAHFPDTSACAQHYTWIYNSHLHTTGGTETDLRTPDDLHINTQNGMMSWSKTKLNTGSSDPHMLYLEFINKNKTLGSVAANDPTRQSLEAVELNMQAAEGSTGSLNGFQCDMYDRSTTGDNSNVCAPSNVFKYSDVGKDWGISLAGYDYSATQPRNVISYTGIENDVQVSGQDMGASLWDPTQGGRHLMWLAANTVQYDPWQPGHAYALGTKIVDAKKSWIWIVIKAGTSSSGSDPTGSWAPARGSYTDGTATFKAKIDYHGVVSKAIYVINDHVDSDYSFYDDVLAVNANVRDTSINLTKEILTNDGGASIRLASGHPIDFSGDGTQAGKNQHTFAYYPADSAMEYRVKNAATLKLGEDGSASVAGSITAGGSLYLGRMSRAAILALASPVEGQTVFDLDEHGEVTYRCPAGTACAWYPVQYGTALSN